jgi:hypothetical protein
MTNRPRGWVAAGASAGAASCCYQPGGMIVGSLTPKTGDKVPTIFGSPAASCCYQRGEIIVRDPAPKTGPDPARSSILACTRPASCCYQVQAEWPRPGWRRTLITCVTAVHFVDLVTTFRVELPVTSGHFGYKVRLGIGRSPTAVAGGAPGVVTAAAGPGGAAAGPGGAADGPGGGWAGRRLEGWGAGGGWAGRRLGRAGRRMGRAAAGGLGGGRRLGGWGRGGGGLWLGGVGAGGG